MNPRSCVTFRNMPVLYGEELLLPTAKPQTRGHLLYQHAEVTGTHFTTLAEISTNIINSTEHESDPVVTRLMAQIKATCA
jgi:hypothetical protein